MAAWTRRREDVGGLTLTVRALPSDGPSLVLLHGLGVSGQVWQGIGRLMGSFARLVAPDLRGHGDSDKPSAGYLPRDYVGDIAALVAHEPSRPLAVIGHSLGAVVAALLAAERPELMEKLVLIDPPFDATRPRDHIAIVEKLRHAGPGALEAELMRREPGMGELYAKALASLYRSAADGAFAAVLRGEPGFPAAVAALRNISVETLVVAADPSLDAALGPEAADHVASILQNGRILTIPGARHAVHASKPRELVRAVRELLAV
ncbi:MAG TPA: alpha/beta hydrolase [Chloroflexota bacterium]|nr:alpha/beta hydrolase [Chloroflexota bacterium]